MAIIGSDAARSESRIRQVIICTYITDAGIAHGALLTKMNKHGDKRNNMKDTRALEAKQAE
jgi:hypothetical protein